VINLQIQWNDGQLPQTAGVLSTAGIFSASGFDNVAPLAAFVAASQAITITSSVNGSGFTYDVYYVVEQLS
jgi:hypothetical protein